MKVMRNQTLKKLFILLAAFLGFFVGSAVRAGALIREAEKRLPHAPSGVKTIEQARQEQRDQLVQERAELERKFEERARKLTVENEEAKNSFAEVKSELQRAPGKNFLLKKHELFDKRISMISDFQRAHETILKTLDMHISLLERYIAETVHRQDTPAFAVQGSFEDLERLEQKVEYGKGLVEQLKKKKEAVEKELKSAKQVVDGREQECAQMSQELEALARNEEKVVEGFTPDQYKEFLKISLENLFLSKELAAIQLKEKQYEMALNDTESLFERSHLELHEVELRSVKASVVVTAEQLEKAHKEWERKRQAFLVTRARHMQEIERIKKVREEHEARLKTLSSRYGIPVDADLQAWIFEPKKTYESYMGICVIGPVSAQVMLLETQERKVERLITVEREKLDHVQGLTEIKEAYKKLVTRGFVTREELSQEEKKYAQKKAFLEATLKRHQTKKEEAEALVFRLQGQVLERIKMLREDVQKQKNSIFKDRSKDFLACLAQLDRAREHEVKRVELLETIIKSYAESIVILQRSVAHVRFILAEFEATTIWYRPAYAISWQGIKNSGVDLQQFKTEVVLYVQHFSIKKLAVQLWAGFQAVGFIEFFFSFGLLLLLFALVWFFLPFIIRWLFITSRERRGWRAFLLFWAMFTQFLLQYYVLVSLWLVIFFLLSFFSIHDAFLYILFYLLSVPYLLYVVNRFLVHMHAFNARHEFAFVGPEFRRRVFTIISVLLYATVLIMLFRQAFIMSKHPTSELPDILLAANFIIFQLALIFLISKEQILSVIPQRVDFWRWVRDQVDRFFYAMLLFVVAIIIMSNPYVGYGRLVLYVLSQLVYTAIAIRLLLWAHIFIKRFFSHVFFVRVEEESARERFTYAKTWFGVAIIFSLTVLGTIGLLLAAQIWGWSIAFGDIQRWFTEPIVARGTTTPISTFDTLQVLGFLLGGFLVALGFNRFVLQKIFELVPVDSGLQHAIASITRYIVIAVALFLGFQNVGLIDLATYIYVGLIAVIGYTAKDAVLDFIAYFIILVQRPMKIGDLVKIDDELFGVVRKITPKSVVLVSRFSRSVVIPNSQVVSKPLYNWNYIREFTAFDDVFITISYEEDVARVKECMTAVVAAHPQVLKSPKPMIRLSRFGEYGYEFLVRGFISSTHTLYLFEIASDIRIALAQALKEQGIKIAVVPVVRSGTASRRDETI